MTELIQEIHTTGDARQLILQNLILLRDGKIKPSVAMAMAAQMKELNTSLQVEINAAKLILQADAQSKHFGKLVPMGKLIINNEKVTA